MENPTMKLTLVSYCHRAPAAQVARLIQEQGWRIRRAYLLPGFLGQVDAWRREVNLPYDFEARLACPELASEVLNWVLAHELAHIVLHQDQIRRGERTAQMERAAASWALEFLLPQAALFDHPEIRALSDATPAAERWARMARVGEDFAVPTSCVAAALVHYRGERTLPVRDMVAA